MDTQSIVQLISNVGFPIAVCIACFWYITKLTQTHKEEVDSLKEAINNNTLVMQKVLDKLGMD